MFKKSLSILIIYCALSQACFIDKFIHHSIPVQEQIVKQLENLSLIADEALKLKIFTPEDRQRFAQEVMVPAIQANRTYALCLRDGDCGNLPSHISAMAKAIQAGIDIFIPRMAITPTTTKLHLALNSSLIYINNLQVKK